MRVIKKNLSGSRSYLTEEGGAFITKSSLLLLSVKPALLDSCLWE